MNSIGAERSRLTSACVEGSRALSGLRAEEGGGLARHEAMQPRRTAVLFPDNVVRKAAVSAKRCYVRCPTIKLGDRSGKPRMQLPLIWAKARRLERLDSNIAASRTRVRDQIGRVREAKLHDGDVELALLVLRYMHRRYLELLLLRRDFS